MLFPLFCQLLLLLFAPAIVGDDSVCKTGFKECAPPGASRRGVPVIGPDLARFYLELVYTVQGIPDNAVAHDAHAGKIVRQELEGDSLCCKSLSLHLGA
jgi:hypothetical protein